jgi:two-component system KDP operon response regulator KdpE
MGMVATDGLPPLVGLRVLIIAHGLELPYDRARRLDAFGYRMSGCGDPRRAVEAIREHSPGAIVVDLGRSADSPGEIVSNIRKVSEAPVLVVGSTGTYSEMLRCLESGADDYCRPGCQTDEIDIRLRALFRRIGSTPRVTDSLGDVLRVGEIEVDVPGKTVRKRGEVVSLSPIEFRLLVTLAEHRGQVIPSKALISRVWGAQCAGESHYLRLYVRYLRQKLEDDPSQPRYIVNRWGAGYSLEEPLHAA